MNEPTESIEQVKPEEPTAEHYELIDTTDQKPPTPAEARKLRKLYVTVRHPRVAGCGHRLNLHKQPRQRNCQTCWFAWFNNNGKIVQQLDEMHVKNEDNIIVALQGEKFFRRWLQFMSTVAQWKQQAEQQKEQEQNELGSTDQNPEVQTTTD
jgi:hypothetical protein